MQYASNTKWCKYFDALSDTKSAQHYELRIDPFCVVKRRSIKRSNTNSAFSGTKAPTKNDSHLCVCRSPVRCLVLSNYPFARVGPVQLQLPFAQSFRLYQLHFLQLQPNSTCPMIQPTWQKGTLDCCFIAENCTSLPLGWRGRLTGWRWTMTKLAKLCNSFRAAAFRPDCCLGLFCLFANGSWTKITRFCHCLVVAVAASLLNQSSEASSVPRGGKMVHHRIRKLLHLFQYEPYSRLLCSFTAPLSAFFYLIQTNAAGINALNLFSLNGLKKEEKRRENKQQIF